MVKKYIYSYSIRYDSIGERIEKIGWHDYLTTFGKQTDFSFSKPNDFYKLNSYSWDIELEYDGNTSVAAYENNGNRTDYWDIYYTDKKKFNGEATTITYWKKKQRNDDYREFDIVFHFKINLIGNSFNVHVGMISYMQSGGPILWIRLPHYFITNLKIKISVYYEDIASAIDPITPQNVEDPNNQKWQFYLNYQKQSWFNKLLTNEEITLLPIECKKYDFKLCIDNINELSFDNDHKLILEDITITNLNNGQQLNTKKVTLPFVINIDNSNNNITLNVSYVDDIFKIISSTSEESKEKFNDLYYYLVIKSKGILSINEKKIDFNEQPNTWFLIPINQYGYKYGYDDILGKYNSFYNLKFLSNDVITSFFTSPLSPLQIGFWNRENIYKLFGYIPSRQTAPIDLRGFIGLFTWLENSLNFLVIPITEEVIKMWINKNIFVKKTFDYLKLINKTPINLPTIWENEPILFSPQILITYIKSINNNFCPIGNDLFNLKYQILYISLITSMLVNNTIMLHLNHFNPQRILSMSKNELCTTINGDLPYKTNAWANWLDSHQTTQDTSYKIYNLTANQRKDNYDTQNYMKMMGMIGSGINSVFNIGLALATGGMGVSGSVAYNFLNKLPTNIAKGTLQKMENARPIGGIARPSIGLIGDLIFGGLTEAKRRDNAYRQMETNNQIDKLNLDSQFDNIKMSSGKDFILPSFQSGAFAQDSGLYLYTLEAKNEYKKQIGIDRLMNGVPVNQILPYNNYDNRQIYNIICINPSFNFITIFNIIKEGLKGQKLMAKFNREYIEYFMKNYLSGITIFKDYKNWIPQHWQIADNYENDVFDDEDNLDDD